MVFLKAVLAPLLFLLFINDVPQITSPCHDNDTNKSTFASAIDIFEDDTTVNFSSKRDNLEMTASLNQWSTSNHLKLNSGKTKVMLVIGKRLKSKLDSSDLCISLNNVPLDQISSHTVLGLIIDDELSFSEHIDQFCEKYLNVSVYYEKLGLTYH